MQMQMQMDLAGLPWLLGAVILLCVVYALHLWVSGRNAGESLKSYTELRRSCENIKARDFKALM